MFIWNQRVLLLFPKFMWGNELNVSLGLLVLMQAWPENACFYHPKFIWCWPRSRYFDNIFSHNSESSCDSSWSAVTTHLQWVHHFIGGSSVLHYLANWAIHLTKSIILADCFSLSIAFTNLKQKYEHVIRIEFENMNCYREVSDESQQGIFVLLKQNVSCNIYRLPSTSCAPSYCLLFRGGCHLHLVQPMIVCYLGAVAIDILCSQWLSVIYGRWWKDYQAENPAACCQVWNCKLYFCCCCVAVTALCSWHFFFFFWPSILFCAVPFSSFNPNITLLCSFSI